MCRCFWEKLPNVGTSMMDRCDLRTSDFWSHATIAIHCNNAKTAFRRSIAFRRDRGCGDCVLIVGKRRKKFPGKWYSGKMSDCRVDNNNILMNLYYYSLRGKIRRQIRITLPTKHDVIRTGAAETIDCGNVATTHDIIL